MAGFNPFSSSCTIKALLGTGSGECDVETLGDLIGGAITTKDVKFNITTDTFLTKYNELVLGKKIFPLIGLYDFDQTTPDNEVATSSIGVKFEIREGKVELTLIYNKSHCAHKSMFTKKGFKKWNILLFFKKHTVGTTDIAGENFKGFDAGMFSVGSFKIQKGTDPQQTKVMLQLTDNGTTEWNERMFAIDNDEINAELNTIDGVIDTLITYESAPAAGTTIVVNVKSACNGKPIAGLVGAASWKLGGAQASATTISGVTESATIPGRYTITYNPTTVATDKVAPFLSNGTVNGVEDINGVKYAGQAEEATIS